MNRTYTSNNRSGSAKRRYRATTTIALAGVSLLAFVGIQAAGQQETGAATQTTVNANGNVAVDEAGNLYVVSGNSVLKMNPDGTNQHTIASGFNFYVYASVAAAGGQVFVSDWSNNQVIAMGSEGTNPHTIATGLCYPQGIAADSTGHVFVAEPLPCDGNGYGGVIVMNADGTNQHAIGTGLNGPYGVAVDSGGHVYVADYDFQKIDVMNSDGTNEHTIASVFANSWFNSPRSVAVDSAGHVFVGSEYNDFVVEMNSDGTNQTRIGSSGTENLSGALAADATGHVYVASFTSPTIVKLSFGVADTTLPDATRGLAYAPVALKADLPGISTSPYATTLKWGKGTLPPPNTTGTGVPVPTTALPKGMKLSSAGILSGTPSKTLLPGTYDVIVGVTQTVSTVNNKGHQVKTKTTVNATIPITIG